MLAATEGTAYSQTLTAFGGTSPYSWSISSGSLPAGLALSTAGVISGTPSSPGISTFTVKVTDSSTPALGRYQAFNLLVEPASTTPILAPGQSVTLSSGHSVRVPSATLITAPDGSVTIVNGSNIFVTVTAGSVVAVSTTATGVANNTVTAQ